MGMHVTDIWDSPEDFTNFQRDLLTADIQEAGIEGQPDVSSRRCTGPLRPVSRQELIHKIASLAP